MERSMNLIHSPPYKPQPAIAITFDNIVEQVRLKCSSKTTSWSPSRDKDESLKSAAATLLLMRRDADPALVLTKRAAGLRRHAGEISLPGGMRKSADEPLEATALRELHEEIGVDVADVEVLGRLPPYRTRTGFLIAPLVACVGVPVNFRIQSEEVEAIIEVPLVEVLNPAHYRMESHLFRGKMSPFYVFNFMDWRVWGGTAGILVSFCRTIGVPYWPVWSGSMFSRDLND